MNDFQDWIDSVDREARGRSGYIGQPLSWKSEFDMWFRMYHEGLTPKEALDRYEGNDDELYEF